MILLIITGLQRLQSASWIFGGRMSVTMWCSTLAPGRDTNVSKRHSRWIRARILFKYATIDHHRAPAACNQPIYSLAAEWGGSKYGAHGATLGRGTRNVSKGLSRRPYFGSLLTVCSNWRCVSSWYYDFFCGFQMARSLFNNETFVENCWDVNDSGSLYHMLSDASFLASTGRMSYISQNMGE